MPRTTHEPPHTLRVAASAVIVNDRGEVLLHRRSDDGTWAVPGGGIERGESAPQAAVREAREETGLEIEVVRLVGVYSRPDECTWRYEDGHVVQYVSVCFRCRVAGGVETLNDETLELRWFAPDALPDSVRANHRRRIADALRGGDATWNG